jgi:hypothetical protein
MPQGAIMEGEGDWKLFTSQNPNADLEDCKCFPRKDEAVEAGIKWVRTAFRNKARLEGLAASR